MSKKILVVDDSEIVRNFHCYIIKLFGFEVDTAENGAVGLEKVLSEKYEVILTDINMPIMDGYEFVEKVRQLKINIPIIIVSTEDENNDKINGYKAGCNAYLVKPTEPEKLMDTIFMLLQGKGE